MVFNNQTVFLASILMYNQNIQNHPAVEEGACMRKVNSHFWPGYVLILALFLTAACSAAIEGQVLESRSGTPVADVLITIRAAPIQTRTDSGGYFRIKAPRGQDLEIAAWSPGYYIATAHVQPPREDLLLELRNLPGADHPGYTWIDPTPGTSENACGSCHPMLLPRWENNAHGRAIHNERFFSFYNGTDTRDNPLDAPGYLTDFPGTAGNCAACHAPGAALDAPFTTDMNDHRGEITAGIHCDFCHKVNDIYLDPATGHPYPNVPGVLAMRVLRPPEDDQIFIGPYPDIHDPDTYAPVFEQSQYCATCHQFSFWGTEIYNSYGEWLESDYARRNITCQDCHMPPSGDEYFALQDQGGLPHPPDTIPAHFQLGLKDQDFMRTTLEMEPTLKIGNDQVHLSISLTNVNAGHHAPTDHPGRHIILIAQAVTADGKPVPLLQGPTIPQWAGDPGGEPGVVYAKILIDPATGEFPVVHYWKPTLIHSDNRIPANQSTRSEYVFSRPDQQVTLTIRVLFRRLYQPIAEIYGWDISETILNEETIIIPAP